MLSCGGRQTLWPGPGQNFGLTWIVTRVVLPDLWSPSWDLASRPRVLVAGGFAFDEVEWLEAERLPYEGGLAAKLVLGRWLKGGTHAVEPLNGVELRSLSMRANAICICGQVGWASIPPADCGIPVLGGSVDGSPDTLADGRIGILVDPDEGEALYEALFS